MAKKKVKKSDTPIEFKKLRVSHISYVTKGANNKTFLLTMNDDKNDGDLDVEMPVKVLYSKDDVKKLVYGVVLEPDTPDSYNHFFSAETIEKAAHRFLEKFRNIDEMHDYVDGAGNLVETFIAPIEMELAGKTVKKGSWVIVTKASDEIWESIQNGTYTGYSIGGFAVETIEKADDGENGEEVKVEETVEETAEEKTAIIMSEDVKTYFDEQVKRDDNSLMRYAYILINSFYEILYSNGTNEEIIESVKKEVESFVGHISSKTELSYSTETNEDINVDNENNENDVVIENADGEIEETNNNENNKSESREFDSEKIEKLFQTIDELSEKSKTIEILQEKVAELEKKFAEEDDSDILIEKNFKKTKKILDDNKKIEYASTIF